jgi:hypothetical protein
VQHGIGVGVLALAAVFSRCNSPYPASEQESNTYYTSFSSEPGTLDPGKAYGSFMYELLCQIVEPPFQYHFLKRPYTLIPLTATEVPRPETRQVTWQGESIQATVYTVPLRRGIVYQDHPCFVAANRRLTCMIGIGLSKRASGSSAGNLSGISSLLRHPAGLSAIRRQTALCRAAFLALYIMLS